MAESAWSIRVRQVTLWLVALLAVAAMCGWAVGAFLAGTLPTHHLLNADAIYHWTFLTDLVVEGGRYADWHTPPSPYFFPDLLLATPVFLLLDARPYWPIAFGVLQCVAFIAVLTFLYREVSSWSVGAAAANVVGGVTMVGAVAGTEPYVFMLVPGFHFGMLVTAPVLMAFMLRWRRCRLRDPAAHCRGLLGICGVLVALAYLSDKMVLLWVLAPGFVALMLDWYRGGGLGRRDIVQASTWLGGSLVAGLVLREIALPRDKSRSISLDGSRLEENWQMLWSVGGSAAGASPVVTVLVGVCLVMLVVRMTRLAWARRDGGGESWAGQARVIDTWAAATMVLSLAVFLTANLVFDYQYHTILYLAPVIAGGAWVACCVQRMGGGAQWAAAMGPPGIIALYCGVLAGQAWADTWRSPVPQFIPCIEAAVKAPGQRLVGVAQYWEAKPLWLFGDPAVRAVQVTNNVEPYLWITSEGWYEPGYDFAVITKQPERFHRVLQGAGDAYRLSRERLLELGGEPSRVSECPNAEVWHYPGGGLQLDNPVVSD